MHALNSHSPYKKQAGLGLIEILLSLFILSIGLLGLVSLSMATTRGNHEAYLSVVASNQLTALAERIRAHHIPARQLDELAGWQQDTQQLLVGSQSSIKQMSVDYAVTLNWPTRKDITLNSSACFGANVSCLEFGIASGAY